MGWEHKRLSYVDVVSVFKGVFLCCMVGRVCGDLKDLQVPCYFIFGDSLVDNGNSNNPATLARANFPPYGVDFPGGATGRFTNGRTTADVLGQLLGFSTFIQPFANISRHFLLQGVNYASAAGGIRNETGQQLGLRTSLDGQLKNHETTVAEIFKIFGSNVAAAKYLRHCLYTVGIGSNDYLNNYFMPQYYPTNQQYTPEKYAQILIDQYSLQLERLFDSGARKVALWGLGPIGCAPYELVASVTHGSPCADDINAAVQLFNERLKLLVDDLNLNFKSAKFTYINIYDISLDTLIDPLSYGFPTANETCCRVGKNNAQITCFPLETPCSNRTEYVFWDAFHPTEAANIIISGRAYSARTPIDTYPWDIKTLVKQEIN